MTIRLLKAPLHVLEISHMYRIGNCSRSHHLVQSDLNEHEIYFDYLFITCMGDRSLCDHRFQMDSCS